MICWVGRVVITFLVFVFLDLRWTRLLYILYFGGRTSCYVGHVFCTCVGYVFCTSVVALYLTLVTSFVLQWAHFILRWTRLLYFRGCTLSYVGHVFCNAADALHLTLDMSSALRWVHFIIRWTRLLYFGGCTTSYVGHVFSLQVGLKRKEVLAHWRNAYPSKNRNLFKGVQHTFVDPHRSKTDFS